MPKSDKKMVLIFVSDWVSQALQALPKYSAIFQEKFLEYFVHFLLVIKAFAGCDTIFYLIGAEL